MWCLRAVRSLSVMAMGRQSIVMFMPSSLSLSSDDDGQLKARPSPDMSSFAESTGCLQSNECSFVLRAL